MSRPPTNFVPQQAFRYFDDWMQEEIKKVHEGKRRGLSESHLQYLFLNQCHACKVTQKPTIDRALIFQPFICCRQGQSHN